MYCTYVIIQKIKRNDDTEGLLELRLLGHKKSVIMLWILVSGYYKLFIITLQVIPFSDYVPNSSGLFPVFLFPAYSPLLRLFPDCSVLLFSKLLLNLMWNPSVLLQILNNESNSLELLFLKPLLVV